MRHSIFSFLFLATSITLLGQPIFTTGPSAGEVIIEHYNYDPQAVVITPGGANQVWDFSSLTGPFESEALEFVSPASLPPGFNDLFPMADLAQFYAEDSSATYFINDADGLYIDGFGESEEVSISSPEYVEDYDPNLLVLPYQFGYQDERVDYSYVDEVEYDKGATYVDRYWFQREFVGDGYGTLTTQAGTFFNVLRIKILTTQGDSSFVEYNNSGVLEFESAYNDDPYESYQFVQNQSPFLLATIEGGYEEEDTYSYSYYETGITGIEEEEKLNFGLSPNPASDQLNLGINLTEPMTYDVMDITGKVVFNGQVGSGENSINTSELHQGIYLLRLGDGALSRTKRFVIER